MIFYRLNCVPDEASGEGEDWNLWFTSLAEAKRARSGLIRKVTASNRWLDPDYSIDRITLVHLPPKQLVLAVLNRASFIANSERVVDEHRFD